MKRIGERSEGSGADSSAAVLPGSRPAVSAGGIRSVVLMAALTALLLGIVLYFLRPSPPKLVPLLIQVRPASDGIHLSILNGGRGHYTVEISGGGPGAAVLPRKPVLQVRWKGRASVDDLPLRRVLEEGSWLAGTPAGVQAGLPPGAYLVEVTAQTDDGALCAGAAPFVFPMTSSRPQSTSVPHS